ncbi:MAG: NADP-dependent malic enzyme [Oscillospiraceae bacterium]|nr:NADP-dependent malic enzyme [Oscillospiraceae bacterium]
MDINKAALEAHARWRGKLDISPKMTLDTPEALSLAYTPGVAAPCLAIQEDPEKSYSLTGRWNTVAVVTDGTAVLGLGDIGPEAAMPVMEGKCALFKAFGGVDAVPLCVRSKDPEEIIRTVELLQGNFGGINLEDISAPRCFRIERELQERCSIPIFHDDQHGTAVVVLAALRNALTLAGKKMGNIRVAISGAGAAGNAIARLLKAAGAGQVLVCDRRGILAPGREKMDEAKVELAALTNPEGEKGGLADALRGADVFVGVSGPGIVTKDMIAGMGKKSIVFACANPVPEIFPAEAMAAGAYLCATGRSDLPNQLNNVLAFPGIFRGALDARAPRITEAMKLAASDALASLPQQDGLNEENILPKPFDPRVRPAVAAAVAAAAGK